MIGIGNVQKPVGKIMRKLLFMFNIIMVALLTAYLSSESSNAANKDKTEASDQELTNLPI